jgi:hypothetical protein
MHTSLSRFLLIVVRTLGVVIGLYLFCMGLFLMSAAFPPELERGQGRSLSAVVDLAVGGLLILPWRWIRIRQVWWPLFVSLAAVLAATIALLLALIVCRIFWPSMVLMFWWPFVALLLAALFMAAQTWSVWRLRARSIPQMYDT